MPAVAAGALGFRVVPEGAVTGVGFVPGGCLLAVGGDNGFLALVDPWRGEIVKRQLATVRTRERRLHMACSRPASPPTGTSWRRRRDSTRFACGHCRRADRSVCASLPDGRRRFAQPRRAYARRDGAGGRGRIRASGSLTLPRAGSERPCSAMRPSGTWRASHPMGDSSWAEAGRVGCGCGPPTLGSLPAGRSPACWSDPRAVHEPGWTDSRHRQRRWDDPALGPAHGAAARCRVARAAESVGSFPNSAPTGLTCSRSTTRARLPLGRATLLVGAPRLCRGRPPAHSIRMERRVARPRTTQPADADADEPNRVGRGDYCRMVHGSPACVHPVPPLMPGAQLAHRDQAAKACTTSPCCERSRRALDALMLWPVETGGEHGQCAARRSRRR